MLGALSHSIPAQRGQGGLIIIPGVSNVSINGGATTALIGYRWPQWLKIVRMMLLTRDGSPATLGNLQLRIRDEDGDLFTDGRNIGAGAQFLPGLLWTGIAPAATLAFAGWTFAPQWRQFVRGVRPNEQWQFQLINGNVGAAVPILGFEVEQYMPDAGLPKWTRGERVLF